MISPNAPSVDGALPVVDERTGRGRWLRRLGAALRALLVLAGLAALGFGAWRLLQAPRARAVHYQTANVTRGAIAAKVTATGTLSALMTVNVGSQVSGRIQALFADFGSAVKAGQVIATIDAATFKAQRAQTAASLRASRANIARAKVQLADAERQLLRAQSLLQSNLLALADYEAAQARAATSSAELELASANLEQAHAAHEQAELNLRYAKILSPIDGVVISRNVDVGQTVAAALQAPTLFSIARDLAQMQVDTNVSEGDMARIKEGMNVSFTVDAYPGRLFAGRVRQVRDDAKTIQGVVTYDAVVDVANDERLLKPGMTASVTFPYAQRDDVLRVPNAALRFRPDPATLNAMTNVPLPKPSGIAERVLWVLRSDRVRAILVHVGISDGAWTEVRVPSEVGEHDAVVVEALLDGTGPSL